MERLEVGGLKIDFFPFYMESQFLKLCNGKAKDTNLIILFLNYYFGIRPVVLM